jgi:carbamoyl-phosphate synthase small subunit
MYTKDSKKYNGAIALEDGTVFFGESFGAEGENFGELVFNTSMTGYQEIITDPSYKGQIIMFTYPLIGNYGVNKSDIESKKLHCHGVVVREYVDAYSNWRADMSLAEYLKQNNLIGLSKIDTRALTRHIRIKGAMKAVISTKCLDKDLLVKKAKESQSLVGVDLVKHVTIDKTYTWNKKENAKAKIVVMDFGAKYNILRMLDDLGYEVTVVPAYTKANEILALNPDGIMLSNGPGDPSALANIIDEIKKLLGKKPIFGICLGHQLLCLALGAKTYKLKFGHRGANHPVKDLITGKIDITSQNHGFSVDIDSLKNIDVELTHMNLYDKTLEGMRHKTMPIFSVQYHPEACPGPHDAGHLFNKFKELIENAG